jgi:hypothetical protein
MRAIKPLLYLSLALLFFTQCQKDVLELPVSNNELGGDNYTKNNDVNCIVVQTLWAGAGQNDTTKGYKAGEVTAVIEGDILYVTYSTFFGFTLSEAHLWVGTDTDDIPRNAAPGRFPYKAKLDNVTEYTFEINLTDLEISPGETIYVAAHGVVHGTNGVEGVNALFPIENVRVALEYDNQFTLPAYFIATVTQGGFLNGVHEAWCIESLYMFYTPAYYTAYSSYNLPDNLGFDPVKIRMVNWLLNQDMVGKPSASYGGVYKVNEVQLAFWILMEGNNVNPDAVATLGDLNMDRVNELVALAQANGANFIPGHGQYIGIILCPKLPNEENQKIIIKYPVPKGGKDTVWAWGEQTFKELGIANNWGWVFVIDCY